MRFFNRIFIIGGSRAEGSATLMHRSPLTHRSRLTRRALYGIFAVLQEIPR
jgi:hypothetical protein